jgi:hypothetical protein
MNRKRDVKYTRIQFNMCVSFLTAMKLNEHKSIKKNCADFFLFHIPRQYLNKFLSLITMHVNKLIYELNRFQFKNRIQPIQCTDQRKHE